jgi:hypothetical protein
VDLLNSLLDSRCARQEAALTEAKAHRTAAASRRPKRRSCRQLPRTAKAAAIDQPCVADSDAELSISLSCPKGLRPGHRLSTGMATESRAEQQVREVREALRAGPGVAQDE